MAMHREYFPGFTAAEKTELWDRWQRGESLEAIGRAFDITVIVYLFFSWPRTGACVLRHGSAQDWP
jgi:hypothetical protein